MDGDLLRPLPECRAPSYAAAKCRRCGWTEGLRQVGPDEFQCAVSCPSYLLAFDRFEEMPAEFRRGYLEGLATPPEAFHA